MSEAPNQGNVTCLYCGESVAEDLAACPKCGAPSHFQNRGLRAGTKTRFVIFFVLLTLISLGMALWLPR